MVYYASDWKLESRSETRVIEICKRLGADAYLSGTGGRNYQEEDHLQECLPELLMQRNLQPALALRCLYPVPFKHIAIAIRL